METNKKLPEHVDSSKQFQWYKPANSNADVTFDFFEHYNNKDIDGSLFVKGLKFSHEYQFADYSTLQYKLLSPYVGKYFYPSKQVLDIAKNLKRKYDITFSNTCVLLYRGNDKNRETKICRPEEYLSLAEKILLKNKNNRLWIQSDETEFIEVMLKEFGDKCFGLWEDCRHIKRCNSSVDIQMKKDNHFYSKNFLAITALMANCKKIVCGTGNCSLWVMLYRGGTAGVFQNLNGKWLEHK